jgi:hypothetical protein
MATRAQYIYRVRAHLFVLLCVLKAKIFLLAESLFVITVDNDDWYVQILDDWMEDHAEIYDQVVLFSRRIFGEANVLLHGKDRDVASEYRGASTIRCNTYQCG